MDILDEEEAQGGCLIPNRRIQVSPRESHFRLGECRFQSARLPEASGAAGTLNDEKVQTQHLKDRGVTH